MPTLQKILKEQQLVKFLAKKLNFSGKSYLQPLEEV